MENSSTLHAMIRNKPVQLLQLLFGVLFIAGMFPLAGNAANEQWITSLSGKVQQPSSVSRPIVANAQLNLQDQWYGYMIANPAGSGPGAWDNIFTVGKAETCVKLRYDDSDRKKMNTTTGGGVDNWKVTIEYTVTCYDETGAGTVYGSIGTPEVLEITYNPDFGFYSDVALRVYSNSHRARLTVLDVSYQEYLGATPVGSASSTIPSYLNDVWLDVEENVSRCYYMDTDVPNVYQHSVNDNQLTISWPYIQGAESYDVEFLFVDIPTGTISASTTEFDFANATRVNTPHKHFRISLAYPRGKIIYRVRGVGRDPLSPQTRVEGPWSYDPGIETVDDVPANSGTTCYSYDFNGLELALNWQYSATYVEDGKKAEAISFYDGSLHSRQNVTVSNTDSNAVISETKYDYQGRPGIQMLPAVEPSQGLQYYQYSDGSGDYYPVNSWDSLGVIVEYEARHFDDDVNTNNAEQSNDVSGAGNYYSPSSTSDGNNVDYVPDAGGYPFAQTRYMNDGTGRVRSQGGTGEDHQLGDGHETRYFYGTPGGQAELDRLFGNSVGYVSHYKKNMVQDPNGQVSIVYLDQEGRVVATCLAGDAPENLIELDEAGDPVEMTVDLLGTNHLDQQQDMVSVNTLTVSSPGDFEFSYSLTGATHCDECLGETDFTDASGCATCKYDLQIMLTNTDGDSIDINGAMTAGYAYRLYNISSQTSPLTFTVNITDIGVYTVTKTLRLAAGHQDDLRQNYIDNNGCVETPSVDPVPCGPNCSGDPIGCPECTEAFTTGYYVDETPYYVTVNGDTLNSSERADSIAYCNEVICGHNFPNTIIPDPCEIKRNNMLADMSPGGQYFSNIPALYEANITDPTGPVAPNPDYLNDEEYDWLNANVQDETAMGASTWFNAEFGAGIDNWSEVKANWDEEWAEDVLFAFHPELCAYNYFCAGVACDLEGQTDPDYTSAELWDYTRGLLTTHTNDLANTSFNPLCMSQNTTLTAGPDLAVDQSVYMPVSGCNEDPYFKCPHEVCDDPATDAEDVVINVLTNYVPVYDESEVFQGYYSIWYLLEDPHNIAGCAACTTYLSQSTIDIFTQVHDGINDGVFTAFDYFRGAYMFAKDLSIAMGYDQYVLANSCPNTQSSPQSYDDGYLVTNAGIGNATPQGFVAHFPENPMFHDFQGCEEIDNVLELMAQMETPQEDYFEDNCTATCEAFAYEWMATIEECLNNEEDYEHVHDLLVEICSQSCDMENPLGTDSYATGVYDPASSQTFYDFEDVLNYYGVGCEIPVHPEPDPASGTCSCENLHGFIDGTGYDPAEVSEQDDITLAFNNLFEPVGTFTWSDIDGWLDECDNAEPDVANLTGMPEPVLCAEPEEGEDTFEELAATDCDEESAIIQGNQQATLFAYLLEQAANAYIHNYRATCLDLDGREEFTVTYDLKEYYYTLYYYDQAGNLVQTVPPAGVNIIDLGADSDVSPDGLTDGEEITQWRDYRYSLTANPSATPPTNVEFTPAEHHLITNYKYNSLQQLIESTTPDGGTAMFWYDEHGRIVLSQNARQATLSSPAPAYSYTLYDALGRPYEAGEMYSSTPMDYVTSRDAAARASWLSSAFGTDGKTQVVHTYYDEQITGSGTNDYVSGGQQNLLNRVASITYEETDDADDLTFDNGTHYSYDIHGNVSTLVQENRNFHLEDLGQSKKRIDYEYDIASGKVNAVHYQQDESSILPFMDEFHHRYEYDANNRVVAVYTSRDGYIWDRDANYLYYDHGPLARTELGEHHVQAMDYAYTIHGWIKGVNSDTRHHNRDIGQDGSTNNTSTNLNYSFARDAAGYSLHYYDGDYVAIGASSGSGYFLADDNSSDFYNGFYALFNGNIGAMTTALTDNTGAQIDVQGRNFRYDQLNRIRYVNAYKETNLVANNQWTGSDVDNGDYGETFTYDLNGNIITAERNGHLASTSQQMDDMHYYYYTQSGGSYDPASGTPSDATNKLNYVDDNATSVDGDYGNDINAGQSAGNYTYDATGNLISDASENIGNIEWTVTGKVKKITRSGSGSEPDLEFVYDAMGNRIVKIVKPRGSGVPSNQANWTYTYYVRDAMGNVLTVYNRTFTPDGGDYFDNFNVSEWNMYGNSRLGTRNPVTGEGTYQLGFAASFSGNNFHGITYDTPGVSFNCTDGCELTSTVGKKNFEITNHLGNVVETVSDIRLAEGTNSSTVVDYYATDIIGYSDYYVFGSGQSNRSGGDYRYGFNGQEQDDEVNGSDGTSYSAEYWQYDSRLGRRWNMDPRHVIGISQYASFNNNPVSLVDPSGDTTYRFDINGIYLGMWDTDKVGKVGSIGEWQTRKNENGEDQQVWAHRRAFMFNDPSLDAKQLDDNSIGTQMIRFVSKANVNWIMQTSDIYLRDHTSAFIFAYSESYGGRMDFNAMYTLPACGYGVDPYQGVLPYDKYGGFMLFEGLPYSFNLNDAGQFLWGQAMCRLGFLWFEAAYFSQLNEWGGDPAADQRAIYHGFYYQIETTEVQQGIFKDPDWEGPSRLGNHRGNTDRR